MIQSLRSFNDLELDTRVFLSTCLFSLDLVHAQPLPHLMKRLLLILVTIALLPIATFAQEAITWETLAQVKLKRDDGRFVPEFEAAVSDLDGKTIEIQGFMLPLDQAAEQQHFILSSIPVADCYFCMPGGPESMVEIKAATGVEFTYNPITVTGTFEVLEDDPMGMYYRLTDATATTE